MAFVFKERTLAMAVLLVHLLYRSYMLFISHLAMDSPWLSGRAGGNQPGDSGVKSHIRRIFVKWRKNVVGNSKPGAWVAQ